MSQNPNVRFSDLVAELDRIPPASQGAGSATTAWLDASQYPEFAGVILVGVLGASATVDAKFQQATSSGGAGAKNITGAAITQITSGNNQEAVINLRGDQLDINNGFNFIQLSITVGVAATLISGVVYGIAGRYGAVQATTLGQIVTV